MKRLLGKWRACAIERGPAQASQMTSCEGREVQFTVSSPPSKSIVTRLAAAFALRAAANLSLSYRVCVGWYTASSTPDRIC